MAIHHEQLVEHGGLDGVRDAGMLDSALARPHHRFAYGGMQVGLCELAAAYAFGIAKNHPFIDGNKRTAFVVCRTFLILNGLDFTAPREARYLMFLGLAEGEVSEAELANWLSSNTQGV